SRKDARHVGDRLPRPHPDFALRDEDRGPAELRHGYFEGEPRPQARLVEDQGERALIQLTMPPPRAKIRLEPCRRREQPVHVGAREIRKRDKVALHLRKAPRWGSRERVLLTPVGAPGRRPL